MISGACCGRGEYGLGTPLTQGAASGTEELLDTLVCLSPPSSLATVAPASTPPEIEEDQEATLARRASHRAVAQFWCFLQEFVEQRYAPEE